MQVAFERRREIARERAVPPAADAHAGLRVGPPAAALETNAPLPIGAPAMRGGDAANSASTRFPAPPSCSSACANGHSLVSSIPPGEGLVHLARAQDVRRACQQVLPGPLLAIDDFPLIARIKLGRTLNLVDQHRAIEPREEPCRVGLRGLQRAPRSSRLTDVAGCSSAAIAWHRVLFPTWRAPITITTRVSLSASTTSGRIRRSITPRSYLSSRQIRNFKSANPEPIAGRSGSAERLGITRIVAPAGWDNGAPGAGLRTGLLLTKT